MDPSKKIFFHDRNRKKNRYTPGTYEFEVSEIFYDAALELTGVAYSSINRAYPKQERENNPKLEYFWSNSHSQAKEFLTRYKNIVKDTFIPLAILHKFKEGYDDSEDRPTKEFKQLIVDNAFYMLNEKLKDFGPLMLPTEDVENYQKVLDVTYHKVKEKLIANLALYQAEPRYDNADDYFEGK